MTPQEIKPLVDAVNSQAQASRDLALAVIGRDARGEFNQGGETRRYYTRTAHNLMAFASRHFWITGAGTVIQDGRDLPIQDWTPPEELTRLGILGAAVVSTAGRIAFPFEVSRVSFQANISYSYDRILMGYQASRVVLFWSDEAENLGRKWAYIAPRAMGLVYDSASAVFSHALDFSAEMNSKHRHWAFVISNMDSASQNYSAEGLSYRMHLHGEGD